MASLSGRAAVAVVVIAACAAAWWGQRGPGDGQHADGEIEALAFEARAHLRRYAANPASKILARVPREELVAQIEGLPAARALEEYAKVLCVQGNASAAERALRAQLRLAEGGSASGGAPPALVRGRLAQVLFARGDFSGSAALLSGAVDEGGRRLGEAPQWWGALQLRLGLLWQGGAANSADAARASLLSRRLCEELERRVAPLAGPAAKVAAGGCAGVADGALEPPPEQTVEAFLRDGYAKWGAPLPPESVQLLQRHTFAQLAGQGDPDEGGGGGGTGAGGYDARQRRRGLHNEPVAGMFHYRLSEVLRGALGARLVPTYVFSVVYMGGGRLYPHLDRPENEVSLTLSLGTMPGGFAWPLLMNQTPFLLQAGEAVLYRGASVRHSREQPLPRDHASAHVIFAFREQCAECCHLV